MNKQTINKETAQAILNFFSKYPKKDYCLATSEQGREVCYWRNNIPYLESLLRQ